MVAAETPVTNNPKLNIAASPNPRDFVKDFITYLSIFAYAGGSLPPTKLHPYVNKPTLIIAKTSKQYDLIKLIVSMTMQQLLLTN